MTTTALIWLGVGLIVCCLEAVVPGIYLIWIGLGAVATGLILGLGATLTLGPQIFIFAFMAGVAVMAGRVWARRSNASDPNSAGSDILGRQCRALAFAGGEGRVRFRDSEWAARCAGSSVAPGQTLRIVGVEGNTLVVAPVP